MTDYRKVKVPEPQAEAERLTDYTFEENTNRKTSSYSSEGVNKTFRPGELSLNFQVQVAWRRELPT